MAVNAKKLEKYWKQNKIMIFFLLLLWFITTFVSAWFAEELSSFSIFGWPISFFIASQGSIFIYLGILFWYSKYMNKLDKAYGFSDGGEE